MLAAGFGWGVEAGEVGWGDGGGGGGVDEVDNVLIRVAGFAEELDFVADHADEGGEGEGFVGEVQGGAKGALGGDGLVRGEGGWGGHGVGPVWIGLVNWEWWTSSTLQKIYFRYSESLRISWVTRGDGGKSSENPNSIAVVISARGPEESWMAILWGLPAA